MRARVEKNIGRVAEIHAMAVEHMRRLLEARQLVYVLWSADRDELLVQDASEALPARYETSELEDEYQVYDLWIEARNTGNAAAQDERN